MKVFVTLLLSLLSITGFSQNISVLFKEADNLEIQLKEPEALDKYKQIILLEPANIPALVKAAELNISISNRQADAKNKRLFIESAYAYANRAFQADSNNANASYAMAMASGKMTDVETENKKIVALVRDTKQYADRALAINPNHARAHYTLGKWHLEMANLSGIKKIAVKLLYGGLPGGDLDSAILHMEKCRSLEPYFVANQLDLAKAYNDNRKPTKALEILTRLVRMPTRSSDDIALKAAGAKMLASLQ